jgi:hypothetical protein
MLRGDKDNLWCFGLVKVSLFRQGVTEENPSWFVVNPTGAISKVSNDVTQFQGSGSSSYAVDSDFIHPLLSALRIHEGFGTQYRGAPQSQREQCDEQSRECGDSSVIFFNESASTSNTEIRAADQRHEEIGRTFFRGLFACLIFALAYAFLK